MRDRQRIYNESRAKYRERLDYVYYFDELQNVCLIMRDDNTLLWEKRGN